MKTRMKRAAPFSGMTGVANDFRATQPVENVCLCTALHACYRQGEQMRQPLELVAHGKAHFRVADEKKTYPWPRGVCGARGKRQIRWTTSLELRESAVVDCPKCMVIKDAWLSLPKRKPLTVRRWRALRGLMGLALVVLVGCSGSPKTLGDSCDDFASAICDRELQCGDLSGSIESCRAELAGACCSADGVDCSKSLNQAQVQATYDCESGYRSEACGDVVNGKQPGACK